MNEYNYNYLGINGIIPNNGMNFMNTFPQNMMNNSQMEFNPNNIYNQNNNMDQKMNNDLISPTEGFIRGNMFANLYDPYKNYKPANLDPDDEKEAMLMSFQQYNFALTDLNLYLDNYPDDRKALNLYKQYLGITKEVQDEYEKKYGPLKCDSDYVTNGSWKWDNSPWPWEVR